MNNLFTPGPWKINDLNPYEVYSINPSRRISDCRPNGCICHTERDRANARLIAAAPDLLSALYEMYSMFYAHEQYDDDSAAVVKLASEAINLATGQEP